MSPEQKSNQHDLRAATIDRLKQRAAYLARVREFFSLRGVLEVETPVLSHATVTDPHIISISAEYKAIGQTDSIRCYLQTSPEYAMKRLLAAGSGPIYQLTKAFRQGEVGRLHNPEFTMLEWYRPGFDHHQLMDELDALVQAVFAFPKVKRLSYADVFATYLNINPHQATITELMQCATQHGISFVGDGQHEINVWLDLLFTHVIEPYFANEQPVFMYDFPVSQAALAKIRPENPPVASRFELYYKGVELANGFHELQNPIEQRTRFERDLQYRQEHHIPLVPIDERFLAALESGLPDCAGVAVGVDRLMMLACNAMSIAEVLSFSFDKA